MVDHGVGQEKMRYETVFFAGMMTGLTGGRDAVFPAEVHLSIEMTQEIFLVDRIRRADSRTKRHHPLSAQ